MYKAMFKRITAILICLTSMLQINLVAIAKSQDNRITGETAYLFLKNICNLDEKTAYDPEAYISRGNFVKLIVFATNYADDISDAGEQIFSDVPVANEYYKYINIASALTFINGSNGEFNPDKTITLAQAVTICSNILGYSVLAQHGGGYPMGYMSVASNYDLLKNLKTLNAESEMNMENTMILLYNALHASYMKTEFKGSGSYSVSESDDTILTERFELFTDEGIVTANAYTDLMAASSSISSESVKVGDIVYRTGQSHAQDYLGYYVRIYYGKDNNVISYCEPTNKNTVYEANINNIEYENGRFRIDNDGHIENITLSSNSIPYIINGKFGAMLPSDIPNILKGTVKFISNDGDSRIDVILVNSYSTDIVSGVSPVANIIRTKAGRSIELKPDEDYDFVIIKNNEYISISEIEIGDIILIAESSGSGRNKIEILACNSSATGTAKGLEADDNYKILLGDEKYIIDGSEYSKINVGLEYICYFDSFGNVAYAEVTNDIVYGYLHSFKFKRNSSGEGYLMKIFTENDRWVELYLDEKVRFNGTKMRAEAIYEALVNAGTDYKQLIRYTVKDNAKITKIETAENVPMGSSGERTAINNDTFRLSDEDNLIWIKAAYTMGGKYYVDENAKVFVIPTDNQEENYRIDTPASFLKNISYSVKAYDMDENCSTKILLRQVGKPEADEESEIMIVAGKGMMLNADDQASEALKGFWNGLEIMVPVEIGDDGVSLTDWNGISNGDLIHFEYSNLGSVVSIKKIDKGLIKGVLKDKYLFGGTVKKFNVRVGHLIVAHGLNNYCTVINNNTSVLLYDRGRNECMPIIYTDIIEGDEVYIITENLICSQVIVFRN